MNFFSDSFQYFDHRLGYESGLVFMLVSSLLSLNGPNDSELTAEENPVSNHQTEHD